MRTNADTYEGQRLRLAGMTARALARHADRAPRLAALTRDALAAIPATLAADVRALASAYALAYAYDAHRASSTPDGRQVARYAVAHAKRTAQDASKQQRRTLARYAPADDTTLATLATYQATNPADAAYRTTERDAYAEALDAIPGPARAAYDQALYTITADRLTALSAARHLDRAITESARRLPNATPEQRTAHRVAIRAALRTARQHAAAILDDTARIAPHVQRDAERLGYDSGADSGPASACLIERRDPDTGALVVVGVSLDGTRTDFPKPLTLTADERAAVLAEIIGKPFDHNPSTYNTAAARAAVPGGLDGTDRTEPIAVAFTTDDNGQPAAVIEQRTTRDYDMSAARVVAALRRFESRDLAADAMRGPVKKYDPSKRRRDGALGTPARIGRAR